MILGYRKATTRHRDIMMADLCHLALSTTRHRNNARWHKSATIYFSQIIHFPRLIIKSSITTPVGCVLLLQVTVLSRSQSLCNRSFWWRFFYVVTLFFGFFCGCRGFCHETESDLFLFFLISKYVGVHFVYIVYIKFLNPDHEV